MGKLIILRHGESYGNSHHYVSHIPDWDQFNFLTPSGVHQAISASIKIPNIPYNEYYVSEFTRSKHTLFTILEHIRKLNDPPTIAIVKELNEWMVGETQQSVTKRAHDLLLYLQDALKSKDVLAISHNMFMQVLFGTLGVANRLELNNRHEVYHCSPYELTLEDVNRYAPVT